MAIAEAWFCAQGPIFVLFLRFVFGLLPGLKIQTWPCDEWGGAESRGNGARPVE